MIKLNRQKVERHKPFIYKLNYMAYFCILTWVVFSYYVTSYGGTMPPRGSFVQFLVDTWDWLTAGILGSILIPFVTSYLLKKRNRRSTDDRK